MQLNPMNSSKCTGNISKNTGKFTGKTDQIRLGGGGHEGGLTPSRALLEGCTLEPTGLPVSMILGLAPRPNAPPLSGEYTRRWLYHLLFPGAILPDGPPNARGPLEVLVGLFTDFPDFLGRLLVVVEFYSQLTTRLH